MTISATTWNEMMGKVGFAIPPPWSGEQQSGPAVFTLGQVIGVGVVPGQGGQVKFGCYPAFERYGWS